MLFQRGLLNSWAGRLEEKSRAALRTGKRGEYKPSACLNDNEWQCIKVCTNRWHVFSGAPSVIWKDIKREERPGEMKVDYHFSENYIVLFELRTNCVPRPLPLSLSLSYFLSGLVYRHELVKDTTV